jgi:signal transduction histidine kinase
VRKALIVLVVAAVVLAAGLVAVALVNMREANALAGRTVELRAFDQATGFARRVGAERPWTREKLRTALEELLGDEVLYAAITLADGTDVVAVGPAPGADRALVARAAASQAAGPQRLVRRETSAGGEEVLEFSISSPATGRRGGAGLRPWRELLGDGSGAVGRHAGPPVMRLGLRTQAFAGHLRRARLVALLSLILAPLIVGAVAWAAWVGRRAERLREEANRRQRLASLGELAATVAHEVRNPLGAIKGYAQLVEEGADPEKAKRAAATMRDECERLERTVTQVLGYAKDAQPRLETLDLREVLDAELPRHAAEAARRDVRLVRDYGDERVEARADRDQLARAAGNLVQNALAVSPAGGKIVVALRVVRRGAELVVSDEGPGVAPEDRERIFEPFYSRREGGTGLGLALVRRIAEAHGGSALVGERPGGGAEFVVRLPR